MGRSSSSTWEEKVSDEVCKTSKAQSHRVRLARSGGGKSRSISGKEDGRAYHESACDHDDDAAFSARGLRIKRLNLVFDLAERQILPRGISLGVCIWGAGLPDRGGLLHTTSFSTIAEVPCTDALSNVSMEWSRCRIIVVPSALAYIALMATTFLLPQPLFLLRLRGSTYI